MISALTTALDRWITGVLPGATVVHELPPAEPPKGNDLVVSLLLERLNPVAQRTTRATDRQRRHVGATFLLTTWSDDPLRAADALARLAVSPPDDDGLELDLEPPAPAHWTALGVPPRASLRVSGVAHHDRPLPETRRVREIDIRTTDLARIRGVVRGPKGVPVPGAEVRLHDLPCSARTDVQGEFVFSSVPAGDSSRALRVTAKGRSFEFVGGERTDASGRWLLELPDPTEWEA